MDICEDFEYILDFESAVQWSVKNNVVTSFLKNILTSDLIFFFATFKPTKNILFGAKKFYSKNDL